MKITNVQMVTASQNFVLNDFVYIENEICYMATPAMLGDPSSVLYCLLHKVQANETAFLSGHTTILFVQKDNEAML